MKVRVLLLIYFFAQSNLFGQDPIFVNYTTTDGLPSSEVYDVLQDSMGYMWFSTDRGVARFDGDSFQQFTTFDGLSGNVVYKMSLDYKGRVWFLASNKLLSYYDEGKIHFYAHNSLLSEIQTEYFTSLAVDSLGGVYLGTSHDGIFYIKDEKIRCVSQKQNYPLYDLLTINGTKVFSRKMPRNYVLTDSVCFYLHDTLKVKSKFNNVKARGSSRVMVDERCFGNSGRFKAFDSNNILKELDSLDLLFVNHYKGQIITGQMGKGIVQYSSDFIVERRYFEEFNISNLLVDSHEGYWFTTLANGVLYVPNISNQLFLKGEKIKKFKGKYFDSVVVQLNDATYRLVTQKGGKLRFHEVFDSFTQYSTYLDSLEITFKNSNLYRSFDYMQGNVFHGYLPAYIENNKVVKKIKDFNKANIYPFEYVIHDSAAFIYGVSGLIELKSMTFVDYTEKFPSLKEYNITALLKAGELLYIGTKNNGLILLENDKFKFIGEKEGLSTPCISSLIKWRNEILIGTNRGVFRLVLEKGEFVVEPFPILEKSINREVYDLNVFKDSSLLIASKQGVYRIVSEPSIFEPMLRLNSAILSNQTFAYDEPIEISFSSVYFQDGGRRRYRYRLNKGKWNILTSSSVSLSDLSPRYYLFEIQQQLGNGKWSRTSLEYSFEVLPPFWKAWYFIVLILFFITLGTYNIYKIRIRQIREKSKLQNDLKSSQFKALSAQMNPHFIFNSLNSIQELIVNDDKWVASKYVTSFSKLLRQNLRNSSNLFVAVKDDLKALEQYIDVERMRFDFSFDYKINVEESVLNKKIPNLLIQPYVENSIWHGFRPLKDRKGFLEVTLKKHDQFIYVSIQDDGIGRKASMELKVKKRKSHVSKGMSITNQRIAIVNEMYGVVKNVEIKDLYDSDGNSTGTKIELWIGVKEN